MENDVKYPLSLLIVEDESELRNILKDYFSPHLYQIYCAENGEKAFEIIEKNNIDCVFSDIIMPKMNGIKLLQMAKKIQPKIMFIFYTAFEREELIRQAAYFGAYDFVAKPQSLENLQVTLFKGFDAILKSESSIEQDFLKQYQELIGLDKKNN